MELTKDNANKITCVNDSKVVTIPDRVFGQGDMLMLFNNGTEFITLESRVANTYRSGHVAKRSLIEWPPKTLINVVFIAAHTAVVTVEVS